MKVVCPVCPHSCNLSEGQVGLCRARTNINGKVVASNYGKITSIALDPIEKKPLARFYPGSYILSVGSYGCNLKCPFCQNHSISMCSEKDSEFLTMSPEELIKKAEELKVRGNIGIAYTYNEPLIGYEFVYDCSVKAHEKGLKNVVVTNGYINKEPILKLLSFIDAMNIDLKGFTESFYKTLGGDLESVKRTIEISSKHCHVEVTTLIISGENDSPEEIEALSEWLSEINPEIPLHLSRFYPRYRYSDREPTEVSSIYRLRDIAGKHLKYVYTGNC